MSTTLKNPTEYFNKVKQRRMSLNCYVCCNLFGKVYEIDSGETKTFPVIKIEGETKDIGELLLQRFGFLERVKVEDDAILEVDKGSEKKSLTDDQVIINPLLQVEGLGEKSVKKLNQAGVQTLEDWYNFKKDFEKLKEVIGPLAANKFKN